MTTPPLAPVPAASSTRRRSWRGAAVGVLITIFWLGMMFTLVKDRILPQRRAAALAAKTVEPETLTDNWKDSEEFMLVKMGDKEVGGAITRVVRVGRGVSSSYKADFRFGMVLNLFGVARQANIQALGELDASYDLTGFKILADLSSYRIEAAGEMIGEELLVEVRQGGKISRHRYKLNRKISMLDAVRPVLARNFEIKPGNTVAIPVIDPVWSMNQGTLQLTVGRPEEILLNGERVQAYPLEMRLNDFVSTSWVDKDGATLRRQMAAGFTMERATRGRVEASAPGLMQPLEVGGIQAGDFAGIPATPLESLKPEGKTPLATLGALLPK